MNPRSFPLLRGVLSLLLASAAGVAGPSAQDISAGPVGAAAAARRPQDPAVAFLAPYGLENFSQHTIDALSALLRAESAYGAGDVAAAGVILDELWGDYPVASPQWLSLPTQPFGLNLGSPPCYYGLRMLTDTVEWRATQPSFAGALRTARLTVVLVGKSSGLEPQNAFQLAQGTGVAVQHELEPALLADDSAIVHASLSLFREYVVAMTEGALDVETNILHLPGADLDVAASLGAGPAYAGLVDAGQVWPLISEAERQATDWWLLVYPSHVPEDVPGIGDLEYVTGGMGTGPDSQSPLFIADDRWLVRKPPHLGEGPYSDVERGVYLPQWLQHEFFHHLFRTYPEFGLEASSHQWFNLATWPADFEGIFEPDYYHEALFKRLQDATPPLVSALRYATDTAPWQKIGLPELIGTYERQPIENAWHEGSIQLGPQLEWMNFAGVDWNLQDDLVNGNLLTGPDCPYYGSWNGSKFDIVLLRDALGDLLSEVVGFAFSGEVYRRTGP